MSPRPNPTQTRALDAVTLRRELKQLLPSDVALDQEELHELLDFSNVGGRYEVLRRKLLRRAISQLGADDVLRVDQYRALRAYRMGDGPRPDFARFASPDGHHGQAWLAPSDPDAPKPAAPWPAQDPNEPGRYVQPKGEFAIPGDGQ